MVYTFHSQIAQRFGINTAIIAEYIWETIKNTSVCNQKEFAGRIWMRSSYKMFNVVFPFLSVRCISSAIKILIKKGILVRGEFNQNRFDRTTWYTFTQWGAFLMESGGGTDDIQNDT